MKVEKDKTIVQKHKRNFETLRMAFKADQAAVMECTLLTTGEKVAVICAVHEDKQGLVNMTPFAMFFNGNPYELLMPPDVLKGQSPERLTPKSRKG